MNYLNRISFAHTLTFTLVFIWSIPGTIALRTLLLLSALAVSTTCTRERPWPQNKESYAPLSMLALLTVWLLFQAFFVSHETAWALGELRGQWFSALLALGLGILISTLGEKQNQGKGSFLWTGIALVFATQAGIAIGQSLLHFILHGSMLRGVVPLTGGKLEMSYIMNILLAIIAVDVFFRATDHRRLLRIPLTASLACATLGLTANYLAGSRNGILGTLILVLSLSFLFLIEGRRKIGNAKTICIVITLVASISIFAIVSYHSDPRWKVFSETAKIALDIDQHKAWLDFDNTPPPLLSNGKPVDASAYQRIAWISAGMRLAQEIPYGVGYGRNAFVRALRKHYPAKLGHSHSGFIDLLSGGGIPAIALWLSFVGAMVITGWRSFIKSRSPQGLLLVLLTCGYTGRMLIESVNRDHMLQIFFFLVGALLFTSTSVDVNNELTQEDSPTKPV